MSDNSNPNKTGGFGSSTSSVRGAITYSGKTPDQDLADLRQDNDNGKQNTI